METIGPFEVSIFHTCYINAIDYLEGFLTYSKNILLPQKAILNTPLKWQGVANAKDFNEALAILKRDNNDQAKYQWLSYGQEVLQLSELVSGLEDQLSSHYWENWWDKQVESDFEVLRQRGDHILFMNYADGLRGHGRRKEQVHIPLYDYINLMNQYLLSGEEELFAIDDLLDKIPHLELLYKVL